MIYDFIGSRANWDVINRINPVVQDLTQEHCNSGSLFPAWNGLHSGIGCKAMAQPANFAGNVNPESCTTIADWGIRQISC